jgi:hypothetical protein
MKSALLSIGFIFVLLLTMNSCGFGQAKEDAEKAIEVFHQHLDEQNYEAILKMIDPEALQITSKEEWVALFKNINEYGKMKKIDQDWSFKTNINNGVTTVELSYEVTFENGSIKENFTMRKMGDGFKILGYFVQ